MNKIRHVKSEIYNSDEVILRLNRNTMNYHMIEST